MKERKQQTDNKSLTIVMHCSGNDDDDVASGLKAFAARKQQGEPVVYMYWLFCSYLYHTVPFVPYR